MTRMLGFSSPEYFRREIDALHLSARNKEVNVINLTCELLELRG